MNLAIRAAALAALALLAACGRAQQPAPPATPPADAAASVETNMAACSELGGETAPRLAACTAVIQASAAPAETRARALNNRGVVLSGQGDNDRAIADYGAALAIDPKYSAAYYNRAQAERRLGQTDKADADAAEAVRLEPSLAGR